MSFTGFRYAVEPNSTRQFLIQFVHGEIAAVRVYAENQQDLMRIPNGVLQVLDDEPNADGSTTMYQLEFNRAQFTGRYGVDQIMVSGSLPEAFLARAAVTQAQDPFQRPQAPKTGRAGDDIDVGLPARKNPFDSFNEEASPKEPAVNNQPRSQSRIPPQPRSPKVSDSKLEDLIKKYGEDLTAMAGSGSLDPVIGRAAEREKIKGYLLRRNRSSVAVIGEPGTGKTTIAQALAQDIVSGDVPEGLKNARLLSINLQGMVAGSSFRGQFEERLLPILDGLKERGGYLKGQKVILFFDEMHSALSAGNNTIGASGAGELIKPYLASKEITCIGTTTIDEYRKHIEKDGALSRRFLPLMYDEPSKAETLEIIKQTRRMFSDHHLMTDTISDEQVQMIIDLSSRYLPTRYNPDKSIGIMDAAGARAQMLGRTAVTNEDILRVIEAEAKLPVGSLDQDEVKKFDAFAPKAKMSIFGQDEAIDQVAETLVASKSGLGDDKQPLGAFLFVGPTGVGKTELCKQLAKLIFDDESAFTKFDMGEYKEKHEVARLIGAPPGFVGSDDENNAQLTTAVRKRPYQVVLFDEVEKAHSDVYDILLSVLNDGALKDKTGKTIDFTNTIIVMTSNLGAKEMIAAIQGTSGMGFTVKAKEGNAEEVSPDMKKKVTTITTRAVNGYFRPEFVQRLDELGGIVLFYPLVKRSSERVMEKELKRAFDGLQNNPTGLQLKNVTVEVTDDVKQVLLKEGYKPEYGARPMRGAVKKTLGRPLGKWIMENLETLRNAGEVVLTVKKLAPTGDERIEVELKPKASSVSNDNSDVKRARKRIPAQKI